jgi:hypothetical protein
VQITNIIKECDGKVYRVSADAGGASLWFESSDMEPRPAPQAFGCALLIPALQQGYSLTIDAKVDAKWLSNVEQLLDIFHEWWGYPKLMPKAIGCHTGKTMRAEKTALFFSGGVDSFFSLLRYDQRIDTLVTVHGFDINLQDATRIAALKSSLSRIAAETGKESIIIRTNVREHPEFGKAPWQRSHGGVLGAVSHLVSDSVGRILISSSYANVNERPWGSHPKTDPLWSCDGLQIVHFGAEFERIEKLLSIAHEPLVRQHLRVCWENLSSEGNCSRCEQCLRNRLVLADCGELANYPVFEGPEFLVRQIDALPEINGFPRMFSQLVERGRLRPDVETAVRNLLKRTKRNKSFSRSLAKRALRKYFSWTSATRR